MKDTRNFFQKFSATDLGTTKTVISGFGVAGLGLVGTRGQQQKMIDVSVEDAGACPIIVSARVEYQNDVAGAPQIGGPIVGIVQWGIGGGENQVEFDIPSGRLPTELAPLIAGVGNPDFEPMTNTGNGAQIYLGAASHVSVYVRHDGYVSPLFNPGGDYVGSPTPAKVIVHIQPATGSGHPPAERTIYVAGGVNNLAADAIPALGGQNISVPPFARSVRVQRIPFGLPVQLNFRNNFNWQYRVVDLGPNDEGPVRIDAATDRIFLVNSGAAPLTHCQCVFDIAPA